MDFGSKNQNPVQQGQEESFDLFEEVSTGGLGESEFGSATSVFGTGGENQSQGNPESTHGVYQTKGLGANNQYVAQSTKGCASIVLISLLSGIMGNMFGWVFGLVLSALLGYWQKLEYDCKELSSRGDNGSVGVLKAKAKSWKVAFFVCLGIALFVKVILLIVSIVGMVGAMSFFNNY